MKEQTDYERLLASGPAISKSLKSWRDALLPLVCPFREGQRLPVSENGVFLFEGLVDLAGASALRQPPSWSVYPNLFFHVDRIGFDHPHDDQPLALKSATNRWCLLGHMKDEKGTDLSEPAMIELTPEILKDRMASFGPPLAPSEEVLSAAVSQYNEIHGKWRTFLCQVQTQAPALIAPGL